MIKGGQKADGLCSLGIVRRQLLAAQKKKNTSQICPSAQVSAVPQLRSPVQVYAVFI